MNQLNKELLLYDGRWEDYEVRIAGTDVILVLPDGTEEVLEDMVEKLVKEIAIVTLGDGDSGDVVVIDSFGKLTEVMDAAAAGEELVESSIWYGLSESSIAVSETIESELEDEHSRREFGNDFSESIITGRGYDIDVNEIIIDDKEDSTYNMILRVLNEIDEDKMEDKGCELVDGVWGRWETQVVEHREWVIDEDAMLAKGYTNVDGTWYRENTNGLDHANSNSFKDDGKFDNNHDNRSAKKVSEEDIIYKEVVTTEEIRVFVEASGKDLVYEEEYFFMPENYVLQDNEVIVHVDGTI